MAVLVKSINAAYLKEVYYNGNSYRRGYSVYQLIILVGNIELIIDSGQEIQKNGKSFIEEIMKASARFTFKF